MLGKKLLSIFAREYRRGARDGHDEVRLGAISEGGTDELDDRLLRRADKPCRTHDDLNDVDGHPSALVELDTETAGEMVDNSGYRGRTTAAAGPVGPVPALRLALLRASASTPVRRIAHCRRTRDIWRHRWLSNQDTPPKVARPEGFEPPTLASGGQCSIH